jgi:predicted TIM-barrel fold metal-dependent hydrolase
VGTTIDVWMQHPTLGFIGHEMFAPLRRYIGQVALDFPELVIRCGHIWYPWTEEMIALARKHENVYIETSAYTAARYPPELVRYMQSKGGRRKVMFGSNFPMIMPEKALESLGALELDEQARELFLSGNAQRLFGLTTSVTAEPASG